MRCDAFIADGIYEFDDHFVTAMRICSPFLARRIDTFYCLCGSLVAANLSTGTLLLSVRQSRSQRRYLLRMRERANPRARECARTSVTHRDETIVHKLFTRAYETPETSRELFDKAPVQRIQRRQR